MPDSNLEIRTIHRPIELRAGENGDGTTLIGYAALFNSESEPLNDGYGEFIEIIAPGAFSRTLRDAPDVRALKNHNTDYPLGRVSAGTLKLYEDGTGLRYELDLPDVSYARDLKVSVERRDSDNCSFGFVCPSGGDAVALVGNKLIRTLLDVDLFEISLGVTFPAYLGTSVVVRSQAAHPASNASTPRLDAAKRRLRLLEL